MRVLKVAAAGGAALSMLVATSAIAAPPTRSASAMPATYAGKNIRWSPALRQKSNQSDDSSGGFPAVGYVAVAALAGAIIVAAAKDGHKSGPPAPPSSPG